MKLTNKQLRQIIAEELRSVLREIDPTDPEEAAPRYEPTAAERFKSREDWLRGKKPIHPDDEEGAETPTKSGEDEKSEEDFEYEKWEKEQREREEYEDWLQFKSEY